MSVTTDTKNALGVGDSNRQIVFKRVNEKVQIEENTTVIETETYGNSFIVGSSLNGVVGINTNTENGLQQLVGSNDRETTVVSVININNIFREHFKDNSFEDSGNTTADWNVGDSGLLEMTNGEVTQSRIIAKDGTTWTKATLTCGFETGDSGDIACQLSADGGSNWETVTPSTEHTFTNTGTELMFKITASGTVSIDLIKIKSQ